MASAPCDPVRALGAGGCGHGPRPAGRRAGGRSLREPVRLHSLTLQPGRRGARGGTRAGHGGRSHGASPDLSRAAPDAARGRPSGVALRPRVGGRYPDGPGGEPALGAWRAGERRRSARHVRPGARRGPGLGHAASRRDWACPLVVAHGRSRHGLPDKCRGHSSRGGERGAGDDRRQLGTRSRRGAGDWRAALLAKACPSAGCGGTSRRSAATRRGALSLASRPEG